MSHAESETISKDRPAAPGLDFLYIRAEVIATDPNLVMLTNGLAERADGQPRPDVVPPVHASCISFRHVRLIAKNEEDAYARGWSLLGDPPENAVCNDYVVPLDPNDQAEPSARS
mgnify:CR=1 FL=1